MQWIGKAKDGCKLWATIGGGQIDTLRAGTDVRGDAETTDYLRLTSPRAGWTKKAMVDWREVTVTPPPVEPPTEPPDVDTPDYIVAHWVDGRSKKYIPE